MMIANSRAKGASQLGALALAAVVTAIAVSLGATTPALAQADAIAQEQAEAQAAYDKALADFKKALAERRAQIDGKKKLPNLPGQSLYLTRVKVIGTYKDLTDVKPELIGRPNKFKVPPAYFDADIEPLIEEYAALFKVMQAPPPFAQASATPFEDVAAIGTAIARAHGLDDKTAEAAGRISLGIFYAETNGNQNIGNGRSNTYKGSLQTGPAEDRKGRARWAALKQKIAQVAPEVAKRDAQEEARARGIDQRYNHWTAVRNGLMNAHGDLFAQLPAIMQVLPDEVDQMKFFQLIQIIPSPTRAALASGNFEKYRVTDPKIMGYLRNNAMFTFGKADRARKSANFREILDSMFLFESKFEKARDKYHEIKGG
jgi:hypothetical protein